MAVAVIGGGLAGVECAWALARHYRQKVVLFEMKPGQMTPAHEAPGLLAELVCSNSLKSTSRLNPASLLKDEMEALGSLLIPCAKANAVPAGETLAVDRERFSAQATEAIRGEPLIEIRQETVASLAPLEAEFETIVVATGPLTTADLAQDLRARTQTEGLYFYDAIAPILNGDTIDYDIAFWQNRETRTAAYERRQARERGEEPEQTEDEGDYLNLPLNRDEYLAFVQRLLEGEKVPFHAFETPRFFSGCQPIEALAESGPRTLSFGPMKPRGLTDPRTGKSPWACVQLRRESLGENAFNMVGFQTRLTWPAQREIFRTLPGLGNVEFFRMGSMHRNTYFVAPKVLSVDLSLRGSPRVFLAGQITGVEGYVESAFLGLLVGHVVGQRLALGRELALPPPESASGALVRYLLNADPKHFSPMNIHWGLFDAPTEAEISAQGFPAARKLDKSLKRDLLSRRAQAAFAGWRQRVEWSR